MYPTNVNCHVISCFTVLTYHILVFRKTAYSASTSFYKAVGSETIFKITLYGLTFV